MTPEECATMVLAESGWDGTLPIDPIRIAQHHDIAVFRDKGLAGSTNSGRCLTDDDGNTVIIVNDDDSIPRQRFTIAHELGHAILDGVGIHNRREATYNLSNYRETEARVNRFAAALLMPQDKVREAYESGKNIEEMALLFGVSKTAIRVRLVRLGILPDVW